MGMQNIQIIGPDSKSDSVVIIYIKDLAQSLVYNKQISKVAIIYGCNVGNNADDG